MRELEPTEFKAGVLIILIILGFIFFYNWQDGEYFAHYMIGIILFAIGASVYDAGKEHGRRQMARIINQLEHERKPSLCDDPLFEKARQELPKLSSKTALELSKRLNVGYARAQRLLEFLELAGEYKPSNRK